MNAVSRADTVYFITLMAAYIKDRGNLDISTAKQGFSGPLDRITLVNLKMAWCMVKVCSRRLMVAKSMECGSMVNYSAQMSHIKVLWVKVCKKYVSMTTIFCDLTCILYVFICGYPPPEPVGCFSIVCEFFPLYVLSYSFDDRIQYSKTKWHIH